MTTPLQQIRAQMRGWGYIPKCSAEVGDHWLLVYENPFAPASRRHFVGTFAGALELYRETFSSDLAARVEFERKATA
jgi:hypothetical protein